MKKKKVKGYVSFVHQKNPSTRSSGGSQCSGQKILMDFRNQLISKSNWTNKVQTVQLSYMYNHFVYPSCGF